MVLSHRDRVLTALNHEEPDRIPTALWGGSYGLIDEIYLRFMDYFDLGAPVAPFREGHSISYIDNRLLKILATDIRYVYPNHLPNSPITTEGESDTFKDSYGQIWHKSSPYYFAGEGILSTLHPGDEITDFIDFPNPKDSFWMEGVAEQAKSLREETDFFVTMRMISSHGPFQTACDLRGTENFLLDMSLHPEFAQALLSHITDVQVGLLEAAMETGGDYFDMIELPGDDYASNIGLMFSPQMFRDFIKPVLIRFIETIRRYRPDIAIMLHSDGLITQLLDDIIEIGIDVIHPLEPLPGLDFKQVKERYGKEVTFLGAIDIRQALPGSKDDVIQELRTRIDQLGPGGGYILAPSNHIQADVPIENIVTLYQEAHQYGKYPLKVGVSA